jgi:glyoxylase-like metal-dependent hydrolase (beta-lactamase superfamily II)
MKKIKSYLEKNYGLKHYIVFNSHHHWDHIWGNFEFKNSKIISHEKCRDMIDKYGVEDSDKYKDKFAKEDFDIVLPNITFSTSIKFPKDEIEFFYSPGHSEDSASCFDHQDKTLFVGDNIDDPIPSFMSWCEIDEYKKTLENYFSFKPDRIVQSHGNVMCTDVINKNIEYLSQLIEGKRSVFDLELVKEKHQYNLEFLSKSEIED